MSNLSQFGGGAPVGSMMTMADLGPTVILADNTTWMRSGVLTTSASAPHFAALPQYKVISGITSTLTASASYNTSLFNKMASNGTGTIVSLIGQNGIIRSTDYGATWSGLITGGGLNVNYTFTDIVYANGTFLLSYSNGSSSNTQFFISYSTTGAPSTWTTYGITNPTDWSGNSYTVGAYQGCSLRWTGAYFVAALLYRLTETSQSALHVANLGSTGTSLSSMVRPSYALSSTSANYGFEALATNCYLSSNDAGGLVVTTSNNDKWAYSSNHGSSWTFYSAPANSGMLNGSVYLVGTKVFLTTTYTATLNSYWVYDTPASTPTLVNLNANVGSFLIAGNGSGSNPAGSKIFSYNNTLQQLSELDTTTYTTMVSTKQLLGNLSSNLGAPHSYCQYIDNKFVMMNTELGVFLARSYTSSFSNATYYGIVKTLVPYTLTTAGTSILATAYYVRIS